MEFKNKLGTVDTHHTNLNFKTENTNSQNITLNFEHLADGSTNLNFGSDVSSEIESILDIEVVFEATAIYTEDGGNSAVIDSLFDSDFVLEVMAVFYENTDVIGQINSILDTSFTFDIESKFAENLCTIDSTLDADFKPEINAFFDINFVRGIEGYCVTGYQQTLPSLIAPKIPWDKAFFKAHNSVFYFEQSLALSNQVDVDFDITKSLLRPIQSLYEQTSSITNCDYLKWQENEKLFISQSLIFNETKKVKINHTFDWVELVRKRRSFTYSHQVAQVFEKRFTFEWDKGLELVTTKEIHWDKAKAIHYRKHPVQPWPKPSTKYVGNTDLNFNCLCTKTNPSDVILNFGADDCIPAISNQSWWYIVNDVFITNLRTNEEILVLNGSYSTDRSQWCWSYNLTVTEPEMSKLQKGDILQINVNGSVHQMMYEEYSKTQKFADTTYTLKGRSQTALLGSENTPVRSYLQENERTSVQLAQAELDRINSETRLNWQLIDELGWIVETESFSYTNLSPIEAIKLIAEAGGGFVYSEKASNTLTIKPLYKKTFWDSFNIDEYDRLIPESLVTQHTESFKELLNFNAITLTNPRNGNVGQIRRRNTAGDILLEPTSNPLFNAVSMGGYGRSMLTKAGRVEEHDFDLPLVSSVGECIPGEVFAFDGQWWGIVDAVSVSFTYAIVNQSVKVERTVNE